MSMCLNYEQSTRELNVQKQLKHLSYISQEKNLESIIFITP